MLRYVGRIDADGKATVGLMRLDAKHAFANIALTDNVVRFATRRYCDNPLIVQGPGSGSRSDRRRRVLGSIAAFRVSRRASLERLTAKESSVLTDVTAFAPATVANVGIGFDILGHTVEAVGDRVRLRRIDEPVVRIRSISGAEGTISVDPKHNTGGRAVQAMHAALGSEFRVRARHREGYSARLRHGRIGRLRRRGGGRRQRAARGRPLPRLQLLKFAMEGEIVASGSAHLDNIAPCLFGGLVLTVGIDHPRVKQIPVPPHGALRARASAHASRHARGARHAERRRDALGFRVADGESRGFHQRLLLERPGHDPRIVQRCDHRAAAPVADSRASRTCSAAPCRPAPWAARFPVPGRPSSPGPRFSTPRRCAARWWPPSSGTVCKSDSWISSLDNYGARVVKA